MVLGGGVAGLAAGAELGERGIVLERESRPGGLVRSEEFHGYWFDRVLHLLHFTDEALQARIQEMMGPELAPCPPVAWIECEGGKVRFPFQLNIGGLEVAEGTGEANILDVVRASEDTGELEPEEAVGERDKLFREAAELCIQHQGGSTSLLQRRLRIGYGRAARIIDQLHFAGILGGPDGSKPREILIDFTQLDAIAGE